MEIYTKLSIEGLCDTSVMTVYQVFVKYEDGTEEATDSKKRMCYYNNENEIERLKTDLAEYPDYLNTILQFWGVGGEQA